MFFSTLSISATGLSAQRTRMDIHAQNLANVDTTRTPEGGPYRRRAVIFEERSPNPTGNTFADMIRNAVLQQSGGGGVRVHSIMEDESDGPMVYEPGHPDANADGYVMRPNVNVIAEMVNMISASRSYEANMTAWSVTQSMMQRTLEISGR
ncbi:MAG: flagellar basal body rod protein FlgC [Clostridiales bacterium]|jgi:flagellar basal-body rod protein FlgC|nr:flagellar basal body rod protein FlgC [Clostridiales bacterium]